MILPCRLLKQVELVSADLTASHSNCPAGMLLVDSFYNTSLQHPSCLGTDIRTPATEEQKEKRKKKDFNLLHRLLSTSDKFNVLQ